MNIDWWKDRLPEGWTIAYTSEWQLYRDGTEVSASWKGDFEELIDIEVSG